MSQENQTNFDDFVLHFSLDSNVRKKCSLRVKESYQKVIKVTKKVTEERFEQSEIRTKGKRHLQTYLSEIWLENHTF